MFKKLSYKVLLIILVVLVIIYFIAEFSGDKERSFRSELVSIDTADVTELIITQPDGQKVVLNRTDGDWVVDVNRIWRPVDESMVRTALATLLEMKAVKVAGTDPSSWSEFDVDDSTGIRVRVIEKGKETADLYVGNFTYLQPSDNQQQVEPRLSGRRGKMISYVRLNGEDIIYGIDGFAKMKFNRKPNHYRDKTIVKGDFTDFRQLTFNYPDDESFVLQKEGLKWTLNGMPVDSAETAKYVKKLSYQKGREFVDDFDISNSTPKYTMRIEGDNLEPIEVDAYPADTTHQFIITSSLNEDAKFSGAKNNLYSKIFVKKDHFLPDED